MVCDMAPLSDHNTNSACVPVPKDCGEVVKSVYCPGANETVCDPVYCMPFSLKETPLGTLIVTPSSAAKLAVTDCGALIVTVVEAEVEEATEPVQLLNDTPN